MEINADPRTNIGQSSRNCAGEEGRGIVESKGSGTPQEDSQNQLGSWKLTKTE